MGASKDLFISEREAKESIQNTQKSIFSIRQDHLTLLASIEELDGELTPEMEKELHLTEEAFKDKAISYGFLIRKLEAESEVIGNEIKRLQGLKQRVENRKDIFKNMLDEGMKEFWYDKIESELLKISYRKSTPIELSETFQDNLLQYCNVSISISEDKVNAAREAGIEPVISDELIQLFDVSVAPAKKRIGDAIKQGVNVPGAAIVEKQNLQIK